ncbi:MAG: GGDEF domain-containing protein [Actinomycetes bacterium]
MGETLRVRWLAAPPPVALVTALRDRGIELVGHGAPFDIAVMDSASWPLSVGAAPALAPSLLLVAADDRPQLDALLSRLPPWMAVESVDTDAALLARRLRQHSAAPEFDTDPLTGVGNRRGLRRWLDTHDGEELVIVEFDIDHTKQINDKWGFEVGDQVLARVGTLLEQHAPRDGYVARMGDDEFIVTATKRETPPALLAEFLRRGAALESILEGGQPAAEGHAVVLSAGVSCGDDPTVLLQQAHLAVVSAKARGRNRTVDFDAMRMAASDSFEERAFEDMTVLAAQRAAELITSGGRRVFSLLRDEAETDPLTGLPNRRFFNKKLEWEARAAVEQKVPLSMIWVDIDHFGLFNKRFSYVVGDSVLRHVAQTLRDIVGDAGWVARWGGEEFAVVLSGCRLDEALVVAERLRAGVEVEDFVPEDRRRVGVTISAGVAQWLPDEQLRDLIERLSMGVALAKEQRNDVRAAPDPLRG